MSRLSLRARLVLGVLLVAAAGLLIADAVTYAALRSSLFDRVDQTLDDDHGGAERYAGQNCLGRANLGGPGFGGRRGGPGGGPGPGVFVELRPSGGEACTLPAEQFGEES